MKSREVSGKEEDVETSKFDALATIKAEGNLAFGVGAGADFYLELTNRQLYLHCNGRLVWGPGGTGGFGASVNLEHIWALAKVVFEGVQYVDYRRLENVNDLMYEFLMKASYVAFASHAIKNPAGALMNAIAQGESIIREWYLDRQTRQKEASILAQRILNKAVWSDISPDKLLPETIGMMLDILSETYLLIRDDITQKERAICALLSYCVKSWRKFEEVLARMNPEGAKRNSDEELFQSIKRLNSILSGEQQREFNRWVQGLAQQSEVHPTDSKLDLAFTPLDSRGIAEKLKDVEQQIAQLGLDDGSRYV